MPIDSPALLLATAAAVAVVMAGVAWLVAQGRALHRVRLLVEQALAGQRGEAATTRAALAAAERALGGGQRAMASELADRVAALRHDGATAAGEQRLAMADLIGRSDLALQSLRVVQAEGAAAIAAAIATQSATTRSLLETKLGDIQRGVNEQLHAAVEKQMQASFARVIDQFAAVQKAMGDVAAVTAQIGDIKRLFGNVKTRGGWGEAQVRAMLDDVLPPGSWEANRKLREGSDDVVEFAVAMPRRGAAPLWLAIDAKFPVEDYERLLAASQAGDGEAERVATRGLERRIRAEARKIAEKYVNPPVTVEFAILYLPTDSLYAEVARIPGLIDEVGRVNRVLVMGPTLFPALLRTIQLGHVTLALEHKADEIRSLLGATQTEMMRMDGVLDRLARQASTFSHTIDAARSRTRAVRRKLKGLEAVGPAQADALLELEGSEPSVADLGGPGGGVRAEGG